MRIEGYGRIRFGDNWPSVFDLTNEPYMVSAVIQRRILEHIVQVRLDDCGDKIGVFAWTFDDNMPLPEGWENGKILFDSREA